MRLQVPNVAIALDDQDAADRDWIRGHDVRGRTWCLRELRSGLTMNGSGGQGA
jgi:hypothetical protein